MTGLIVESIHAELGKLFDIEEQIRQFNNNQYDYISPYELEN